LLEALVSSHFGRMLLIWAYSTLEIVTSPADIFIPFFAPPYSTSFWGLYVVNVSIVMLLSVLSACVELLCMYLDIWIYWTEEVASEIFILYSGSARFEARQTYRSSWQDFVVVLVHPGTFWGNTVQSGHGYCFHNHSSPYVFVILQFDSLYPVVTGIVIKSVNKQLLKFGVSERRQYDNM
jgi:hypothetical protein